MFFADDPAWHYVRWFQKSDEQGLYWESEGGAIRRSPPPQSDDDSSRPKPNFATQSQNQKLKTKGHSATQPQTKAKRKEISAERKQYLEEMARGATPKEYQRSEVLAVAVALLNPEQEVKVALENEDKPKHQALADKADFRAEVVTSAALRAKHYGGSGAIDS